MPKVVNSSNNPQIKAVKEFTDREEPRKVFWEKYNKKAENIENNGIDNQVSVISYYGYGGIGKSTLLLKLNEEINQKAPNTKTEFIDFEKLVELNKNVLEILKVIRYDLKTKYDFSFPIFDLVVYVYETKLGKNATKPELKSIFEDNKELNFLLDIAEEIPLLGTITKVVTLLDKGKNILQERVKNHKLKDKLLNLESQNIEKIKSQLQYYFAVDLAENLKKESCPFVFIIDTYEKLVNELSAIGNPLDNDLWLRGNNGLILNMPNTLWIIAGREKLKWTELDKEWEESLSQHLLGTLSFTDTKSFLEIAGINNEELIHQLYDLTHGSPIYLDMCVDTYVTVKSQGKEADIKDFGEDTTKLIKRFLMYMNDTERDFSIMLAYIPSWTDETIEEIAIKMVGSFSFSLYEKVKNFSFIVNENGKYKMNESIKDIIIANTPNAMRQKFLKITEEETNQKINKIITVEEEKVKSLERQENKPVAYFNNYEVRTAYENVIDNLFNNLCMVKDVETFKSKAQYLVEKIEEYEKRFDMPITLEKYNQKSFNLLEKYKNTPEYAKLICFKNLDINSALKNEKILGEHGLDRLYSIKRFLRYTEKEIEDIARFSEIYNLLKDNKNLYYIKLLELTPHNYSKYDEYQKEYNQLVDCYQGEANTFYIEILLSAFEKVKKNRDGKANKDKKYRNSDLDRALAEFNAIMQGIHSLSTEIEEDNESISGKKETDKKIEKDERFYIIIKKFQENPKLLTAKILNEIFKMTGFDLREKTRKSLFDYLYSIKYIPLNSSDVEIIDSFYNIFKEYLGGTYNISESNSKDEEIISKSIFVIEQLKEKYTELYGEDSFAVNEAETYIIKHKILEDISLFDKIIDKNIEKFGILDYRTQNTIIILTKEIYNYLKEKLITNDKQIKLFDSLIKYGNQILDNINFEEDNVDDYTYLVGNIYDTLIYFFDYAEIGNQKIYCKDKIYTFCYKALPFHNDKKDKEDAKKTAYLFNFAEKCIDIWGCNKENMTKIIEIFEKIIIDNKWTNPCLEGLVCKCVIYLLDNELGYETDKIDKNVDAETKVYFSRIYRESNYNLKDIEKLELCRDCKSDGKNRIYYNFLILRVLSDIVKDKIDTIIQDYYKMIDQTKSIYFKKESPTFYFIKLVKTLKDAVLSRYKLRTDYERVIYAYYLNIMCTIIGETGYSMDKYTEKLRKKRKFKKDYSDKYSDRYINFLKQMNDTLKAIRYRENGKKDIRYDDATERYKFLT